MKKEPKFEITKWILSLPEWEQYFLIICFLIFFIGFSIITKQYLNFVFFVLGIVFMSTIPDDEN